MRNYWKNVQISNKFWVNTTKYKKFNNKSKQEKELKLNLTAQSKN